MSLQVAVIQRHLALRHLFCLLSAVMALLLLPAVGSTTAVVALLLLPAVGSMTAVVALLLLPAVGSTTAALLLLVPAVGSTLLPATASQNK